MSTALLPTPADWLAADPDADTRTELQGLLDAGKDAEVRDRFSGELEFGTAGLRGVLGAGPMRMNRLVVRRASAALAAWVLEQIPNAAERGIVVGHDARIKSDAFAREAAGVFAAAGIRVHFFDAYAATPLVAWAVTHVGAAAGVMVTASHNPPEYNGYKVYWENGAQIIPPHDTGIAARMAGTPAGSIASLEWDAALQSGRVNLLGDDVVATWMQAELALPIPRDEDERETLPIVYTAMHGVGARFALKVLAEAGFANVIPVPDQVEPDGRFPTVRFPNPEEPAALKRALEVAEANDARLILANDPDADRVAVAARDSDGAWHVLTGDQIGSLLGEFLLRGSSGPRSVGTTIVSSRLLASIAAAHEARCFTTLTGFKWIANGAMALSADEGLPFVFGYEEAIGFTVGELVRDKDGIGAVLAIATLAARLDLYGLTLLDALDSLFLEHGVYLSAQRSITRTDLSAPTPGVRLRQAPPTAIAGVSIARWQDLQAGIEYAEDGTTTSLPGPRSDVLVYFLSDQSRVIVRPSGTEPKVKMYYEVIEPVGGYESIEDAREVAQKRLDTLMTTDF